MILTNKLNLPQPFVDAATNDHEYTEGRYSVTELLGGTCEAILKRRHNYSVNYIAAATNTTPLKVREILDSDERQPKSSLKLRTYSGRWVR